MSTIVKVTGRDLRRAVLSSDQYVEAESPERAIDNVVRLALMSLGLSAIGDRTVEVDLANGYSLRCTVVSNSTGEQQ